MLEGRPVRVQHLRLSPVFLGRSGAGASAAAGPAHLAAAAAAQS